MIVSFRIVNFEVLVVVTHKISPVVLVIEGLWSRELRLRRHHNLITVEEVFVSRHHKAGVREVVRSWVERAHWHWIVHKMRRHHSAAPRLQDAPLGVKSQVGPGTLVSLPVLWRNGFIVEVVLWLLSWATLWLILLRITVHCGISWVFVLLLMILRELIHLGGGYIAILRRMTFTLKSLRSVHLVNFNVLIGHVASARLRVNLDVIRLFRLRCLWEMCIVTEPTQGLFCLFLVENV